MAVRRLSSRLFLGYALLASPLADAGIHEWTRTCLFRQVERAIDPSPVGLVDDPSTIYERLQQMKDPVVQSATHAMLQAAGDMTPLSREQMPWANSLAVPKVRGAIVALAKMKGLSGEQRSAAWNSFAGEMGIWSDGKWGSNTYVCADGSCFASVGQTGSAVFFRNDGRMYRTTIDLGIIGTPKRRYRPDYGKMTLLNPDDSRDTTSH